MTSEEFDVGYDLQITSRSRRESADGTWVKGTLNGHRFEALAFAEHADSADWEYEQSRLSKLWVQRIADRTTTFHWDRGMDVPAADAATEAIVSFLAEGLADLIYAA